MRADLISALQKSNKWWKDEFELDYKHREIYPELQKFMATKQIIALTGLRRVGKTVLLFKIAKDSLIPLGKENILYFSFDDFANIKIIEILEAYEQLMEKEIGKGRYLVLLDEVQKISNWEEQLKRIYDEHKNIKFVISGSESLFIRKKSRETLAGRLFEFHIKQLTFKEFLGFRGKTFSNLSLFKSEILKEFDSFLLCNGFPEIVNETREVIEKYIKDNIIDRVIFRDIPQIMKVREPAVLEQLFKIILAEPGQLVNIDDLAQELGLSRQTISLYLAYLENSYLIKKLYNFSRNARKTQRRSKKYYPVILMPELLEKSELFGKVFETAMVLQLNA